MPASSSGSNNTAASPAIPEIGSMFEHAVGTPAASASSTGSPKPSNVDGYTKAYAPREQLVQLLARNPTGELHGVLQTQRRPQLFERLGVKSAQTCNDEPKFRTLLAKFGESAHQPVQILVGMQRRDGEQKRFAPAGASRFRRMQDRRPAEPL